MTKIKYYKGLFLIGAIWNWIVAPVFFFAYKPIIKSLELPPLQYVVPLRLSMALVFVFGIAYFYVFKDLARNRNCAKLGVYSKTLVFVLLTYYWIAGEIVFALVIPGVVDLIFAGLFLEFLIRFKHIPEIQGA
jgi:hypothetical protein